ncbi:TetR/AcrR family transcriptional regulator [Amycolatopsis sp. NPDC005232]|uniref:TetR/AcrR family transcriptional regulator n=1 Tax=Amycolatopsis sp. NPDC005232 TaxID=3157027 RepID=UPI0033A5D65C
MVVEKATRTYRMRRRADAMEDTRRRITEAIVELHGSIGPARTTIAGIAETAGVQRHTVYRYFPTEEDQLAACAAHFWGLHPRPDLEGWQAVGEPAERITNALKQLYAFYSEVEPMLVNSLRDAVEMPAVERALESMAAFLEDATSLLSAGWSPARGRKRFVVAAVRHALAFDTWRSLVREAGLSTNDAAKLMATMVAAAKTTP